MGFSMTDGQGGPVSMADLPDVSLCLQILDQLDGKGHGANTAMPPCGTCQQWRSKLHCTDIFDEVLQGLEAMKDVVKVL